MHSLLEQPLPVCHCRSNLLTHPHSLKGTTACYPCRSLPCSPRKVLKLPMSHQCECHHSSGSLAVCKLAQTIVCESSVKERLWVCSSNRQNCFEDLAQTMTQIDIDVQHVPEYIQSYIHCSASGTIVAMQMPQPLLDVHLMLVCLNHPA